MLGLHTKNGWRAGFAIAVTGTLIGIGSGAAIAAPTTIAEAEGVQATGAIVEILDTGSCHTSTPVAYPGTEGEHCGEGLSTNTVSAFAQAVQGSATNPGSLTGTPWVQNATINPILQGTAYSRGYASVGPIDIDGLNEISLTDIFDGLADADTDTVLNPLLVALGDPIGTSLQPLLGPLDDVLGQVLTGVEGSLPVSLVTGAVEAQCQATGSPLRARAASTVDDLNLVVGAGTLGANGVVVPVTGPNGADTPPNTQLLVEAPQELVDAIIDSVEASLSQSLGDEITGAPLEPVNLILAPVQAQVIDALLEALEPALLQPLSDALEPLIQGTVNKQTPNPSSVSGATGTNTTGSVEVIALEVILLAGGGPDAQQTLQLGRSECGPNAAGTATPTPTPTDDGDDSDDGDGDDSDGDDSDGDDSDDSDDGDDGPKSVDSGLGGNMGALAITGLLAASTLVGSAARQRLLLDR